MTNLVLDEDRPLEGCSNLEMEENRLGQESSRCTGLRRWDVMDNLVSFEDQPLGGSNLEMEVNRSEQAIHRSGKRKKVPSSSLPRPLKKFKGQDLSF